MLEMFLDAISNRKSRDVKGKGQVFTPIEIGRHLVSLIDASYDDFIVEPSIGVGNLAFVLFDYLISKFGRDGFVEWFNTKFIGYDIDADAISQFVNNMGEFTKAYGIEGVEFSGIKCADPLEVTLPNGFKAIANPPYVRFQNLDVGYRDFLKTKFKTCRSGNVDLYYAFVEWLGVNCDISAIICPNSFIRNNSGRALKEFVCQRLEYFHDFGSKQVFTGVGTYTCVFRMGGSNETVWTDDGPLEISEVFPSVVNNGRKFLTGIATNADVVFRIPRCNILKEDTEFVYLYGTKVVDGQIIDLTNHKIEKRCVAAFKKLTQRQNDDLIVCPYDKQYKVLQDDIPCCIAYLSMFRQKLKTRDGGAKSYEAWYAYARRQGFHSIGRGDYIAVPTMIGGDCYPHVINFSDSLEQYGRVLFVSGILMERNDENECFLSREFIDRGCKLHGKPMQHGWFSISKTILSKF